MKGELALNLQWQGKDFEAEEVYLPALAGLENALGIEHPETRKCASSLAWLYAKQGRWREVEELEEQVAERRAMAANRSL